MTLKDFLKIVKTARKIPGSQKDIAHDLCSDAGIGVSTDTIDKWIVQNDRVPRLDNRSINNVGFIHYFEKHTKSTWQNMQKDFSERNEHNFINCHTQNPIIFYRSLLGLFYDVLRLVPVSLRHILPSNPLFLGRENELKRISDIFTASNYAIITGIGGSGKSYLALAYAHSLSEEDGWIIQYIICENSDTLQTAISKLQFVNCSANTQIKSHNDEEHFDYIITDLKNCINPTLIILDNFNHTLTPSERKNFEKLKNCDSIHFLITSRNTLNQDKQHVVHTLPLDDDSLLELYGQHRFKNFIEHKKYFDDHKDILNKLFTLVEKHTLMITLLAKLSVRCSLSETRIYELLKDNLNLPSEEINITKDNIPIENPLNVILKKIFDISQLIDNEKSIMKYMSLMPLAGVDIDLFEKLTSHPKKEIDSLVNSCWIIKNEETFAIRLHPLICNVIQEFDDSRPSIELCRRLGKQAANERDKFPENSTEWNMRNKIVASSLWAYYNIEINKPLEEYFNWYKNAIKNEIRTKLKLNPKSDSKNSLIKMLKQYMPESDEFSSDIINTLISKLKTISEGQLTESLVNRLVDNSVNECKNDTLYIIKFLKEYSEDKDLP